MASRHVGPPTGSPPAPGRPLLAPEGASVLASVGAMLVAAGVVLRSTGLDTAWMLHAHAHAPSPAGVVAWSCLTVLGLGWSVIAILLALDRGAGQGRMAALLVPTLVIAALLARVPKSLLAKPRPAGTDIAPQLHVIGHAFTGNVSMPSGHAVAAGALLAVLLVMLPRGRRLAAGIPVAVACLAISLSRVMVGAHWPSDVFVGTGLGLLSVSFALAFTVWHRTAAGYRTLESALASRRGQFGVGIAEIGMAAGLLHENTGYPAAQPLVYVLAVLAVLSALWRWLALPRRQAP